MNHPYHHLILTSLLILTLPRLALANDDMCDYQISDEAYFDIAPYTLTENDVSHLAHISDYLLGSWRGELIQYDCVGADMTLRTDTSPVTLEISMPFSRRLDMSADLDYRSQHKRMYFKQHILEKRDIVAVVSNDDDAYIITEKAYHQNAQRGTSLVETIYKFHLQDHDTLRFDIITISNGSFSLEQRWYLSRW